jgi:hypothetical protein
MIRGIVHGWLEAILSPPAPTNGPWETGIFIDRRFDVFPTRSFNILETSYACLLECLKSAFASILVMLFIEFCALARDLIPFNST